MKKFFMAVIAIMMTASVSAQFYIYLSNGEVLQADSISMVAPSGGFSVSATKRVHFSKGNLQYQASTQTWRFAENQYDIIGEDNQYISSTNEGWIDLFGWGTGNNPTNTSQDYNDYATFTDWGNNMGEGWYTLSKNEWYYIFYTRTNAASLFALGCVNGINGTIILPDNWVTPAGASFTPSTTQCLVNKGGYYSNSNNDSFTHNTYTVEQWSVMESAGAVFLPAAGRRGGTFVYDVGSNGNYWSSAPNGKYYAYNVIFNSGDLGPQNDRIRSNGQSVRLVQDVK